MKCSICSILERYFLIRVLDNLAVYNYERYFVLVVVGFDSAGLVAYLYFGAEMLCC